MQQFFDKVSATIDSIPDILVGLIFIGIAILLAWLAKKLIVALLKKVGLDQKLSKIKKSDDDFVIELERNPDILKELGGLKKPNQVLVGFAAETQNLLQYAQSKLEKKNLDFIVANDVSKPGAGFQGDTNIIKILSRDGSIEELPLMTKRELSAIIMDRAERKLK